MTYSTCNQGTVNELLLGGRFAAVRKRKKITNTNDLVELAEKYIEAHGSVGAFSKAPSLAPPGRPSSQNMIPEMTSKTVSNHKDLS
ncbi:hypothetical protein PoB_000299000 [Plakobranchus ocellatus]|uniref:Uncharacterized protein n=1 Tax=Plakobranchus ocellatus TaxID=259542 RepID=A0AAV3Y0Q8_9GAST|nr:hypothetical protein PoB_000299000 [Plakobranchus ocellatus]